MQWFGDLVTMRDWGELWLNEGFASYFENLAGTIARPNFAYFETFYPDFAASALAVDAMPKSTHPLATLTGTAQPRSHRWNPSFAMGPCSLASHMAWTLKASAACSLFSCIQEHGSLGG